MKPNVVWFIVDCVVGGAGLAVAWAGYSGLFGPAKSAATQSDPNKPRSFEAATTAGPAHTRTRSR